jgi:hypothetical protein
MIVLRTNVHNNLEQNHITKSNIYLFCIFIIITKNTQFFNVSSKSGLSSFGQIKLNAKNFPKIRLEKEQTNI